MESHKKAFTLIEILVVMGIVGFILIVQLVVLTSKLNQYGAPYHTVYNALKRASQNVLADMYCPDCTGDETECPSTAYVCPNYSRNFPMETKEFCERLAGIEGSTKAPNKGFFNVVENNCASAGAIDATKPEFTSENVQFVTSNSMKFYISTLNGVEDYVKEEGKRKETQFFIVYVDLNGNKNPNRINVQEGSDIMPDIVPFAVTRRGEVVPMGVPTESLIYMSARVCEPTDDTEQCAKKEQMTFKQAVLKAWPSTYTKTHKTPYRDRNFPYTLWFDDYGYIVNSETDFVEQKDQPKQSFTPTTIGKCTGGSYTCRVSIDKYTSSRY